MGFSRWCGYEFFLHPVVGSIHVRANAPCSQLCRDLFQVRNKLISYRDAHHLLRRKPGRKYAGVVFEQNPKETFN